MTDPIPTEVTEWIRNTGWNLAAPTNATPACKWCGQTEGHAPDCELVLRLQVIAEREAETKEPTAA